MTRNTIDRDGITSQDVRYFIFNFKLDVMTFCHSVRGHWSAESMHWLLDVVYREDHHQTLDKRAAFNLNLIRKMCLYFLKVMVFSKRPQLSMQTTVYLCPFGRLFGNRG